MSCLLIGFQLILVARAQVTLISRSRLSVLCAYWTAQSSFFALFPVFRYVCLLFLEH